MTPFHHLAVLMVVCLLVLAWQMAKMVNDIHTWVNTYFIAIITGVH